jgi:tetratricopeptide (TPR) repeat protein
MTMATIALPAPAFAVEGVSERQQRNSSKHKNPNQAQEALNNNNPDLAIELFTKSINSRAFNDQPDAMGNLYFGRGNAYRRKGDCTSAIADYTKALEFVQKGDLYFSRAPVIWN